MSELIKLTWDEWVEQFKPVKNPIVKHAPYDGYMFETYGAELEWAGLYNKTKGGLRCWTLVDDGEWSTILEGWHIVNRLGYFVTEEPFDETKQYNVDSFHWVYDEYGELLDPEEEEE